MTAYAVGSAVLLGAALDLLFVAHLDSDSSHRAFGWSTAGLLIGWFALLMAVIAFRSSLRGDPHRLQTRRSSLGVLLGVIVAGVLAAVSLAFVYVISTVVGN